MEPSRLTSTIRSIASPGSSRIGPPPAIPALEMQTSMPPKRSTAPSTASWMESRSVTSASNQAASGPQSAATFSSSSGSRPTRATFAPLRGDAPGALGADAARGAGDEDGLTR